MKTMKEQEWRSFLMSGTRTGKLATTRSDGGPHVAPIWFVLDGDDVVFTTGRDTVKGRNLLRDPRAMLAVDDERPPFALALVQGTAKISEPSAEELLPWTTRLAARYMGSDQAEAFGKRNAVEGELLVRIPLSKVTAHKEVAD